MKKSETLNHQLTLNATKGGMNRERIESPQMNWLGEQLVVHRFLLLAKEV